MYINIENDLCKDKNFHKIRKMTSVFGTILTKARIYTVARTDQSCFVFFNLQQIPERYIHCRVIEFLSALSLCVLECGCYAVTPLQINKIN